MRIASVPTLLVASALDSPALWHAFVAHDLDPRTALLRFLIAVPVAAVMLALLRLVTKGYGQPSEDRPALRVEAVTGEPMPHRRTTDQGSKPDEEPVP